MTDRPPAGSSFERFFAEEYAATVRLAHLLTGSNAHAEDLAQDAFARVLPHLTRLDNPAAYLRTATVNVCRTWHRTRGREQDRFRRHGASPDVAISAASSELRTSSRARRSSPAPRSPSPSPSPPRRRCERSWAYSP